jgi:hypothetical protein
MPSGTLVAMSHRYVRPFPGAPRSLPCGICARNYQSHLTPVVPGTKLSHNDLVEAMGRCDGSCGTHAARPFGHNDLVRLYGRCNGSCGTHR